MGVWLRSRDVSTLSSHHSRSSLPLLDRSSEGSALELQLTYVNAGNTRRFRLVSPQFSMTSSSSPPQLSGFSS